LGKVFVNKDNKIRLGFKLIIFILVYSIFTTLFMNILIEFVRIKVIKAAPGIKGYLQAQNYLISNQIGLTLSKLVDTMTIFIVIFILLKVLDNKGLKDIGFNSISENRFELLCGLILGAVSMTIVFILLLVSNNIVLSNSLIKPNFSSSILIGIPLFILVAISEETICRGYILNILNQMEKPWLSVVMSSAIFAVMHIANPNAKLVGILNIFLVGLLFSFMYIRTKSLWMPIGYHFTWNYFQGNIFGFPVSGQTQQSGIYIIKSIKENIFTGGAFGPEGGILTSIVIIAGMIFVWKFTNKWRSEGAPIGTDGGV